MRSEFSERIFLLFSKYQKSIKFAVNNLKTKHSVLYT